MQLLTPVYNSQHAPYDKENADNPLDEARPYQNQDAGDDSYYSHSQTAYSYAPLCHIKLTVLSSKLVGILVDF